MTKRVCTPSFFFCGMAGKRDPLSTLGREWPCCCGEGPRRAWKRTRRRVLKVSGDTSTLSHKEETEWIAQQVGLRARDDLSLVFLPSLL